METSINIFKIDKPSFRNPVKFITLHWQGSSHFPKHFPSNYHFSINGDGYIYYSDIWHQGKWGSHTYNRNTSNIGISCSCLLGGTEKNYGEYPPTTEQVNAMCFLTSQLVRLFRLPLSSVKTHHDWARIDGYEGERWDWKFEGEDLKKRIELFYRASKPIILGEISNNK